MPVTKHCCVVTCTNNTKSRGGNITIFKPVSKILSINKKEQRVAEHWRDANPDAFDCTKPIDYVCSDHFLPKDVLNDQLGRRRLMSMYVVPRIFNAR